MYKPQYLNIVRATKSAYGNNIAYFKKTFVTHNGYKWDMSAKKENKSGRHFLGKIK
ncbi:hypothetical protein [Enterococcus faecalis]|uniref:hypothetical protein n=1 Tax=Enterococcus faecalis TaxID=1351 RepID=UPI0018CCB4AC|nr:hypothetical protein [Enterococcus faecalis]MDU6566517.1 hypothetical protein [Enterococcus faecalis]HCY8956388.1 hypothetical protein [Enterococcus faecalis]